MVEKDDKVTITFKKDEFLTFINLLQTHPIFEKHREQIEVAFCGRLINQLIEKAEQMTANERKE